MNPLMIKKNLLLLATLMFFSSSYAGWFSLSRSSMTNADLYRRSVEKTRKYGLTVPSFAVLPPTIRPEFTERYHAARREYDEAISAVGRLQAKLRGSETFLREPAASEMVAEVNAALKTFKERAQAVGKIMRAIQKDTTYVPRKSIPHCPEAETRRPAPRSAWG